jgi:hypothetical protein
MKHSGGPENIEAENALGGKMSVARELVRLPVIVAALGYLVDMLSGGYV